MGTRENLENAVLGKAVARVDASPRGWVVFAEVRAPSCRGRVLSDGARVSSDGARVSSDGARVRTG